MLALGVAATIVAVKNYGLGVDYQTSALCTTYHTLKFSNQKQYYTASAAGALLSLIVLTITMIMNLRACCCKSPISTLSPSTTPLWTEGECKFYYLMYSLALTGITVVLGTYLSLLI